MNSILRRRRGMMGVKTAPQWPEQEIGVELITEVKSGKILDTSTGQFATNSGGRYEDEYIPINPAYTYTFGKYNNRTAQICRYDRDKRFVGGEDVQGNIGLTYARGPFTDCVYIRYSANYNSSGALSVKRRS